MYSVLQCKVTVTAPLATVVAAAAAAKKILIKQ